MLNKKLAPEFQRHKKRSDSPTKSSLKFKVIPVVARGPLINSSKSDKPALGKNAYQ